MLTPLDTATGPVDVIVTNKGVSTTAFSVEMKAVAPTFLLYNPQGYVIATHANYSYLGPTTLFPGASTPAKVGETVVTYAVGFGLPTATLVNGSSTQSGLLPEAPVCTVNRLNAPASVALIAPGLYQLNITVPSGAKNGDNALDCSYRGASTFAGGLLSVAVP